MSVAPPLARIAVGVVVERRKGASPWVDYLWAPVAVLAGVPDTPPWTTLSEEPDRVSFYAGAAEIELHRTETEYYGSNLLADAPSLWVVLRATEGEPPYRVFKVTADPAEGEGFTEAGNDIVETVAMPPAIQQQVAAFVAEHHVDRTFIKRVRDRADPEAMSRGGDGE
ncbi:MAG: DUF3305 domain-containing protein [Pseudolabrys sp.]